jgi:hypothetical protein
LEDVKNKNGLMKIVIEKNINIKLKTHPEPLTTPQLDN